MRPNQVHDVLISQCENNYMSKLFNNPVILPSLCGIIAFPTTIGLFQHFVWKKLHIAAHAPYARFCGAVTVCVSSLIANYSFKSIISMQDHSINLFISHKDVLVSSLLSIGQFYILTRSFKVVLPSHLLHVGAFARQGIPLKPELHFQSVTHAQSLRIQELGYQYGCHSCGKKHTKIANLIKNSRVLTWIRKPPHMKVDYIGDHQPPKALVANQDVSSFKGSLYPQCKSCSQLQASRVRLANGSVKKDSDAIVTHSLRFKIWKIFIPWLIVFDVVQYAFDLFL